MASDSRPFWERKRLEEMTREEWESLCDGCGKCCLHKLQDEDTQELLYTRVACRYLEQGQCRCSVYSRRSELVPACIKLEPGNLAAIDFMPGTCAYRRLFEGLSLPAWHPLITGDRRAMEATGNTVAGRVISEDHVPEEALEEHVIRWVS